VVAKAFKFTQHTMSDRRNNVFWLAAASVPLAGIAWYAFRRTAPPAPTSLELPGAPADWTVPHVTQWLERNGASKSVVDAFARNGIDGRALLLVQDHHMTQMGITLMADRMKTADSIALIASPRRTVAAAANESDGDEVVDVPVVQQRASPSRPAPKATAAAQRNDAHVLAASAAKLKEMYDFFGGDDFLNAPREVQHRAIEIATEQTTTILNELSRVPDSEQRDALVAATDRLMEVVNGTRNILREADEKEATRSHVEETDEGDDEEQAPQREPNMNTAAAAVGVPSALKVAEVLEQFQTVLTSPEMLQVPQQQRAALVDGIRQQLQQIRSSVLPALPPHHVANVRDSIDSLLELCARLTTAGSQSAAAPPPRSPAHASKTAAEQQTGPTPASLQFVVTRLRNVFETVRSPTVLGEENPIRRLELLAAARREADVLATEGQRLPADQREIVAQVVDNVVGVIEKLAEASRAEAAKQNSAKPEPDAKQRSFAVAQALSH